MPEPRTTDGERPRKKTGRPCLLDPALADEVIDLVRTGNYVETAAAYVGLAKDTLYAWMKKGARAQRKARRTGKPVPPEDEPFARFSDALTRARARAEVDGLARIEAHGEADWRAEAWRMERLFGGKYAPQKIGAGQGGPPVEFHIHFGAAPMVTIDEGDDAPAE